MSLRCILVLSLTNLISLANCTNPIIFFPTIQPHFFCFSGFLLESVSLVFCATQQQFMTFQSIYQSRKTFDSFSFMLDLTLNVIVMKVKIKLPT